ncbi:deoxyribonuclease II [Kipferlia bialata]|nr:deoxyribonuclease II [Kipferlia bialata]|eukprot:g6388.t1
MKGVVATDSATETGLWITHSVPEYPWILAEGEYEFPDDELVYGQSMMCISLEGSEMDVLGDAFSNDMPNYYGVSMPSSLSSWAPSLYASMVQDAHTTKAVGTSATIVSRGGDVFTLFSKSKKWNQNLWEDLVAVTYASDLYVETWGRPLDGPDCKGVDGLVYTVTNVRDVAVDGYAWSEGQDHSKWAVSMDSDIVCIGDINRMSSQMKRGGGAVCMQNSDVWHAFSEIIVDYDVCGTDTDGMTH